MKDLSKQPKWVQEMVAELKASQTKTEIGASVSNCSIENNAIKHTEHTATAITSICEAVQSSAHSTAESARAIAQLSNAQIANAEAIKEAAKSLNGGGVNVEFGSGINLSDIKHS